MRARLALVAAGLAVSATGLPGPGQAQSPTVASINLCTDQLVLGLAAPEQILSLSWLAADPEESMLAASASRYPTNYGSAEELIGVGADVVIAGTQTSPFTRQLLSRLGARVVAIEPAVSLADIARNLRLVGAAIDRDAAALEAIDAFEAGIRSIRERRPRELHAAIVVRPGGFTIGQETLAAELLELAGLYNSVAELDRWGSLAVETLLSERPEYLVLTRYRDHESSLANGVFSHPALVSLADRQATLEVEARYFACGAPASLIAAEMLLEQMAVRD